MVACHRNMSILRFGLYLDTDAIHMTPASADTTPNENYAPPVFV